MTKLSGRERLLLYVLLIVLAVAAGWFLIKPAMNESAELDDAILEAEMQKTTVEQAIAARPGYAESVADSRASIEELKKDFLPLMTNDDLDRYITGLLQRHGLVAESLLISPSADEATSLAVTKLHVQVTATGELEQLVALAQNLSGLKGIRIASLTVQEDGEKIMTVPLTPEEIEERAAADAAAKKKPAKEGEALTKEVSVMQYDVTLGFEVMEFDDELFAAMGG